MSNAKDHKIATLEIVIINSLLCFLLVLDSTSYTQFKNIHFILLKKKYFILQLTFSHLKTYKIRQLAWTLKKPHYHEKKKKKKKRGITFLN